MKGEAGVAAAVIGILVLCWGLVFLMIRKRLRDLGREMEDSCRRKGHRVLLGPSSANYRGADAVHGRVRGNGMICLTDRHIIFRKLFGAGIEIPREEVEAVTAESWFKEKTSFATGGKILVVHTRDGNRTGFLLKDWEMWMEHLSRNRS